MVAPSGCLSLSEQDGAEGMLCVRLSPSLPSPSPSLYRVGSQAWLDFTEPYPLVLCPQACWWLDKFDLRTSNTVFVLHLYILWGVVVSLECGTYCSCALLSAVREATLQRCLGLLGCELNSSSLSQVVMFIGCLLSVFSFLSCSAVRNGSAVNTC